MHIPGNVSVRFDMKPTGHVRRKDPKGALGSLVVTKLTYLESKAVVKREKIDIVGTVKISDVVSAIRGKGYENYDFHQSGEGCRYWITKTLQLLRDKGHIGSFSKVSKVLAKAWDERGEVPGKSVEKGTFHHQG